MTLAGWCTGSLVQAFLPPATFQLSSFVYCENISVHGHDVSVRPPVGYFMIACGTMEMLFESTLDCVSSHHSGKTEYWHNTF
ncbi:hypothetical protein JB92DRAFT_3052563 [Gautieria morchelliformis]|nr:hypothetical protein JB92DRAFT_3052563 [Gautieria morchelliformis]